MQSSKADRVDCYVPKYVQSLLRDSERRAKLVSQLESNLPYVETGFGAVVTVQLSGLSTLTAKL
ncbi:hypothetical protein HDV05_003282, partial [Chytridiales sp. JEL 0842]